MRMRMRMIRASENERESVFADHLTESDRLSALDRLSQFGANQMFPVIVALKDAVNAETACSISI